VDVRLHVLRQTPFFRGLAPEALEKINQLFHEYGYVAGETIFLAGSPSTRLYIVASGTVKLLRHTMKGQDVVLDLLMPGEFFGSLSALGDELNEESAQAQTACCVLGIDTSAFERILSHYPPVALQVLSLVAGRLRHAQELVRQLSAYPVEHRIAATLLNLANKLGEARPEGLLIQIPLSRQDLAEMTGTTTESVSRVLSQLRDEGLVNTGRQWVAIIDPDGLAKMTHGENVSP
jgi:CRP-like cAMP-binding protein